MCSFRRRKLGHPPRSHKLPLHGDPTCLCLSVSPSATALSDARDEVRRRIVAGDIPTDGLVVELAAGDYPLAEPLGLGPEDTGSASAPITWRAQAGKNVRLLGGVLLQDFLPVTDAEIRQRLAPQARDHIRQIDLRAHGVTDFGEPVAGGLELFFDANR